MNSLIEILNQRGEGFLRFALPMLWQSSLLITALFAFDFLFRRQLRASLRYALWLVVLFKLCLPPTLALPTSPAWWLHPTPPVVAKPEMPYTVTYDNAPLPELPPTPLPVFVPPQPALDFAGWLLAVSVLVSSALFGWLLVRWWQMTRQVQRAKICERLAGLAFEVRKLAGLKSRVPVKLTANSLSPAVCGLFRPVLLLPQPLAGSFSDEQLRAVLLHELIHLRRRDVWVNFFQALLQIAYWWHPLVWLANARLRRVREEAVDDAVMLALHDRAEAYAPTLLEVAKLALNRPLVSLGLVGIMESRSALRQRIERLVDFRAPRQAGLTLFSLLGILAFTAVAVPMGQGPAPAEKVSAPAMVSAVPLPQPANIHTNLPEVLITTRFYQAAAALKSDQDQAASTKTTIVTPAEFARLQTTLESAGYRKISAPRVVTISGERADIYVGNGTNSTSFSCRPTVTNGLIELMVQGQVVYSLHGALTTNQFASQTAIVENHGAAMISVAHPQSSGLTNLIVLTSVEIVTDTSQLRPRSQAIIRRADDTNSVAESNGRNAFLSQKANADTTNVMGILTNPNFSKVLHALEQRSGVESLAEPEVTTMSSGRGINRITLTNISVSLSNAYSATPNPIMVNSNSIQPFKADVGGLVRDGKLLYEMGKLDEAEVKLKAALARDAENAAAKYYLGLVQSARQNQKTGQIKRGRQNILEKLYRIRFDQFGPFTGLSLGEVVSKLVEATGISMSVEAGTDINQPVNLPSSLLDIRAVDALDAVILHVDQPIKYSVFDDGVVFSQQDQTPVLFSRTFRVDANAFLAALQKQTGLQTTNVSLLARSFFGKLGINLESPKGKAVFYGDRLGVLFVKATESDLDTIERAIEFLNAIAPQIHIKARFLEVPPGTVAGFGGFLNTTNSATNQFTGILNAANLKSILHSLASRKEVEILAEPEVTTTSGRQTQMRATRVITVVTNFAFQESLTNDGTSSIFPQTTQVETGPVLDVVPYVLADGYTINLTIIPSLTEFLGYATPPNIPDVTGTNNRVQLPVVLPQFSTRQLTANLNLWDGQTVVVGGMSVKNIIKDSTPILGSVPLFGRMFRRQHTNETEILVFVTAEIVDPAGHRVHQESELPCAQKGVPPQPPPLRH